MNNEHTSKTPSLLTLILTSASLYLTYRIFRFLKEDKEHKRRAEYESFGATENIIHIYPEPSSSSVGSKRDKFRSYVGQVKASAEQKARAMARRKPGVEVGSLGELEAQLEDLEQRYEDGSF